MATLLSQAPRAPLSCRAPLLRRRRSAAHVGKGVVTVSSSESQNNGVNGSSGGGGDSGGDGHRPALFVVQKLGQKLAQRVRDEPLGAVSVVISLGGFYAVYLRRLEGPPFTEPFTSGLYVTFACLHTAVFAFGLAKLTDSSQNKPVGVHGGSGGGGNSGGDGHTRGLVVVQNLGQKLVQRVRDEPLAAACVVISLGGFYAVYLRLLEGPPYTEPFTSGLYVLFCCEHTAVFALGISKLTDKPRV